MTWAMEQQLVTDPHACSVLIALGNHADRDGTGAFPSVETLRRYTKLSERTIRTKLAELEATGIIRRGNQAIAAAHIERADRRPVVWDLAMELGVQEMHPVQETGVQQPHPEDGTGCSSRRHGVQLVQERGARAAPKPSLNHPEPRERPIAAASHVSPAPSGGTEAGRACRLMREVGCGHTNPSHPNLVAAIAEGVTPEVLRDTAAEAVEAGADRPFAWAITTARSRHARGAAAITAGAPSHEPHRRLSAVERVRANVEAAELRDAARADLPHGGPHLVAADG